MPSAKTNTKMTLRLREAILRRLTSEKIDNPYKVRISVSDSLKLSKAHRQVARLTTPEKKMTVKIEK